MRAAIKLMSLLCCFFALASLQGRAASYCEISSAYVAFGTYDPLGSSRRDTIGSITVTCMGNAGDAVSYSLLLDTMGQQGNYRVMMNGVHQLNYLIFADNGYTQVWGDGNGGSTVVNDSYTMATHQSSRTYPLYGRVLSGQHQAKSNRAPVVVEIKGRIPTYSSNSIYDKPSICGTGSAATSLKPKRW